MNVTKNVYNKIVNVCKLINFNAFIIIYIKFNILKIVDCAIINEFDIKFRNIINELIIYSFNSKINKNWFIYKYFDNLIDLNNVCLFINRWIFNYNFFDNDIKTKFKLNFFNVIHVYETQYVNFLINVNTNDVVFSLSNSSLRRNLNSKNQLNKTQFQKILKFLRKRLNNAIIAINRITLIQNVKFNIFTLKLLLIKKKINIKKRQEKKR